MAAGRKPRLSDEQLMKYANEGRSLSYIAEKAGVTRPTISNRLKGLKARNIRNIARDERLSGAIIERNIDAASQLGRINFEVTKLLDKATDEDSEIQRLVEAASIKLKEKHKELTLAEARNYLEQIVEEFYKNRDTIFRASAEIREQIRLQLDIFKVWFSHQAVQDFQRIVLDAVNSASPDLRDRIINELRNKRVIR